MRSAVHERFSRRATTPGVYVAHRALWAGFVLLGSRRLTGVMIPARSGSQEMNPGGDPARILCRASLLRRVVPLRAGEADFRHSPTAVEFDLQHLDRDLICWSDIDALVTVVAKLIKLVHVDAASVDQCPTERI